MAPIIDTDDSRATTILDGEGTESGEEVTIRVNKRVLGGLDRFNVHYKLVSDTKQASEEVDWNPKDFIFLEGNDGREGHPDLWVAKHRLGASELVKRIAGQKGLSVNNTAQERNGPGYIGDITYEQALRLNLLLGGRTMYVGIARELFGNLLSEEVYDGDGKKVDVDEVNLILNEIIEVRSPLRGELYEDTFETGDNGLVLKRDYILKDGVLVPRYSAPLESHLMESKTPGIDFKGWVEGGANSQGWPRENVNKGKLFYGSPVAGCVAGFGADSDRAGLVGGGYPRYAGSGLGVRHLREAPKK